MGADTLTMTTLYHKEYILDCSVSNPPTTIKDGEDFTKDLVDLIGMELANADTIKQNPVVWYCDEPGNKGLTVTAIITTSSIVLHCYENYPETQLRLNVYSCKDFNRYDVLDFINAKYGIIKVHNEYTIDRN